MINIAEKYWKVLTFIPIAFLVLSIGILASNIITKGYAMDLSMELTGGKSITIETDKDIGLIKALVPDADIRSVSGVKRSVTIEVAVDKDEARIIKLLKDNGIEGPTSARTVGPSVGSIFLQQTQISLIVAFILVIIVVFILFRSLVPSSIVILAMLVDIIGTMATLSLIDVKLSLPVIGALITIIGYSVDTDILLTSELLKRTKETSQGIKNAAKTGLTMSITALVALTALYIFGGSFVLEQIAIVLIIGIIIDMPATWITNAGILRFWLEKKV